MRTLVHRLFTPVLNSPVPIYTLYIFLYQGTVFTNMYGRNLFRPVFFNPRAFPLHVIACNDWLSVPTVEDRKGYLFSLRSKTVAQAGNI